MNRSASVFTLPVIAASGVLLTSACTQSVAPGASAAAYPQAINSEATDTPSSNPSGSLPQMSPDRCVAEAIGTATNPDTGAPEPVKVDPQTGKPVCPPDP